MRKKNLLFRAWYYFRTAYSTYLTFILGVGTFLTTVYYLLIKSIPVLEEIFPNFWIFVLFAVVAILPLGILLGWLHFKHTPAYRSQIEISYESNPYLIPTLALILEIMVKHAESEGASFDEELQEAIERQRHLLSKILRRQRQV